MCECVCVWVREMLWVYMRECETVCVMCICECHMHEIFMWVSRVECVHMSMFSVWDVCVCGAWRCVCVSVLYECMRCVCMYLWYVWCVCICYVVCVQVWWIIYKCVREFPLWLGGLRTQLGTMRLRVQSVASFSGLRIWPCLEPWCKSVVVQIWRCCGCGQWLQLWLDP